MRDRYNTEIEKEIEIEIEIETEIERIRYGSCRIRTKTRSRDSYRTKKEAKSEKLETGIKNQKTRYKADK